MERGKRREECIANNAVIQCICFMGANTYRSSGSERTEEVREVVCVDRTNEDIMTEE